MLTTRYLSDLTAHEPLLPFASHQGTLSSSHTQHRPALGIDVVHIAAPVEQMLHHLGVAHGRGGQQWSATRTVHVVHISVILQQQLAHLTANKILTITKQK